MGAKSLNKSEYKDPAKQAAFVLGKALTELEQLGWTVTVSLVAQTPLAMGNYKSKIEIREARSRYANPKVN
jgi:hypothetical protein